MMLGLTLSAFTTLHVVISLIAIVTGLVVMFGMLSSTKPGSLTGVFLLFTILTSVTGFMFPFTQLLPSHMLGILSLVLLAIACIALYGFGMSGAWRGIWKGRPRKNGANGLLGPKGLALPLSGASSSSPSEFMALILVTTLMFTTAGP